MLREIGLFIKRKNKQKKQKQKNKNKNKSQKKYQNCIKSGLFHNNNNNNTDAFTLGGSPFTATSVHKREKQTLNVQTFNIF